MLLKQYFRNVKHIDGSKTKCYCYKRRYGEFGRKTNLDSLKLSSLKGVKKVFQKVVFASFSFEKTMKCVVALIMVSNLSKVIIIQIASLLSMYNAKQDSR
jgi:hypothetical protein